MFGVPYFSSSTLDAAVVRSAAETYALADLQYLVDAYLEAKAASQVTRVNYRSRLKLVVAYLRETQTVLVQPDFDLGEQFLVALVKRGLKKETIRAHATVLRTLFEALAWAKIGRFDPFFMLDITQFLLAYETEKKTKEGEVSP